MDDVIYFRAPSSEDEWSALADGFAARNADFPDGACIFGGTLIRTRRPSDFQWQQFSPIHVEPVYGLRIQAVVILMVPYDERGGKRLTSIQRWYRESIPFLLMSSKQNTIIHCSYNYHFSETQILVECVFGRLKTRFKVLHGVTDRRKHTTNARMICAAAVLHNLLIDIGDKQFKPKKRNEEAIRKERYDARQVMSSFNQNWDRTPEEDELLLQSAMHTHTALSKR
ncbi:Hypothetical protein PHPALM_18091 [Phytophthora palmivora]|uniref:DDE Tnp4 domain-containing protein n=1 Tax=Phytophthora palmivora TaxID=4796 RepID=A0A2P4XKS0_9STRA|nr:Hypothetical protein PHPALM_18091 [Phytophthora palmivora]